MNASVICYTDIRIVVTLLFAGIIVFYFVGLRVAAFMRAKNGADGPSGLGPFEGAMLGLISLLLAFTFNKSAAHYDDSRQQIVHETNCIGTVLLRADLYPDSVRQVFRNNLHEYIAARIDYYQAGGDEGKIHEALLKGNGISAKIWALAAAISKQEGSATKSMQMIPAVNDMIDAVSVREEVRAAHIPASILWLLLVLCAAGSFIVGYAGKSARADWIILLSYCLMTVMTVYLILDLDHPRQGVITTGATHAGMYELLEGLKGK